ncbi:MAG: DUF2461 domain-containing protein [Ruminococcaceae bacterium]|nr:DUF2461 domain-containing protein [Oscillospiraceae bacterium]
MITPKALDFLFENRLKDSKQWFEAHKGQYRELVVEPLIELSRKLSDTMLEIDTRIIVEPKKTISRIYRDIRFSRDKTLYRDVMWLVFMRDKKLYNGLPGYFFEFSPRGFRYGCGYYQASNESLNQIRSLILSGDKSFKKALKTYESQDVFSLEGDKYKRSRYPEAPENVKDWLERKNFCFIHNSKDFELLFSKDLADTLKKDFLLIEPIYEFLSKAQGKTGE